MAKEQRVITPLVESEIQVEPTTPPAMGLNTRIQRAWSLLFGRRENTLQPVYASRAGMLGVVALDLNGWKLVHSAAPAGAWTDMGQIVDLIMYTGFDDSLEAPYFELGPDGVNTEYIVPPVTVTEGYDGMANITCLVGVIHVRTRWYKATGCFNVSSRVVAYTAPKR